MRLKWFGLSLALASVVTAACGDSIQDQRSALPGAPRELALQLQLAANLEPFDDCQELLGYFEQSNNAIVRANQDMVITDEFVGAPLPATGGPTGGREGGAVAAAGEATADAPASAGDLADTTPATGGPAGGGSEFSTTNIQEKGVDEPDLVKTNGDVIAAVAQGRLQLIDPEAGATRVVGSVQLPEGSHEIFLHEDRVIVLTRSYYVVAQGGAGATGVAEPGLGGDLPSDVILPSGSATVVSAVDISDPSAPNVTEAVSFEGDYVSARLSGGVVRLVLTSYPVPAVMGGGEAEDTEIDDWLPNQVEPPTASGGAGGSSGALGELVVPCDKVSRPPEPSGTGTVTVLTIDAGGSMQPIDTDAVVADATTIYASSETLYVATNQWYDPTADPNVPGYTTEMHAFDISDPETTTYLASGRVRGHLLNQYSVSEHEGNFRVATTDGSPWGFEEGSVGQSESFVTVMHRDGDRLATIGQVGGLGKGEEIQSVRYIGDLGFVVTFRQTDPLYAIDLSEPTAPKVLGELKVNGFSAYLHPIDDGRLLGVGQDATDEGTQIGTQVSLFDVSNPQDLKRLDNVTIENASSAVEYDPKAFLFWEARDLALVPIEIYGPPVPVPVPVPGGGPEIGTIEPVPPDDALIDTVAPVPVDTFSGLVVFTVGGDDVAEAGRITHQGRVTTQAPDGTDYYYGGPSIQRAIVVGNSLYTLSEIGMLASDLSSLADQGFAEFGGLG